MRCTKGCHKKRLCALPSPLKGKIRRGRGHVTSKALKTTERISTKLVCLSVCICVINDHKLTSIAKVLLLPPRKFPPSTTFCAQNQGGILYSFSAKTHHNLTAKIRLKSWEIFVRVEHFYNPRFKLKPAFRMPVHG